MRTHRRAWTPPLPLTLATLFAVSSPLALTGCQKVKSLVGDEEEEESKDKAEDEEEAEAEEEPEAKAEEQLEEAKEAGLAESALAATPEVGEMAKLGDLLALAPKIDNPESVEVLFVVRDASVFLDYLDEVSRFAAGPVAQLGEAAKTNPDLKELSGVTMAYPMVKAQYDALKGSFTSSGVHLDKGMLLTEVDGRGYIIYSGDQPDALPKLIKQIEPKTPDMACKAAEAPAGYVVCADSQADLDAYTAGGAEGATAVRARWSAALPGVDFEKSNIIAEAEGAQIAIETPPGLMVMSIAPPAGEPEFEEMVAALSPSQGKLLRGVQPGAGFMWGNVSRELIEKEMLTEIQADKDAPESVKALASNFNGEVLLAGHYEPAAVALQFGLDSDDDWAAVAGELEKELGKLEKEAAKEMKIEGGEWEFNAVDIPVGGETVKAMHAGLSGVPEADVLAGLTGLTIDGWAFAANDAMTIALGASPEAIGHVASSTDEGPSEGLLAYLPPTLSSALQGGQVSMIAHMPLDALHGPQTRQLLTTALKNVPDVSPELVIAFFNLASPLSSGTLWMTHHGDTAQFHVALQSIGHHADEEGKAALAAAVAVAGGAEPAAAFGPLVDQYPDSPRVASYKARSGQTPAALVASGVGAMVAGAALAVPIAQGARNEDMSKELDIDEGAADKAKQESKDKAKKKQDKKKQDARDEKKKEEQREEEKKKREEDKEKADPTDPAGGDDGSDKANPDGRDEPPGPKPGGDEGAAGDEGGGDEGAAGDDGGDKEPTRPKIIPGKPKRVPRK